MSYVHVVEVKWVHDLSYLLYRICFVVDANGAVTFIKWDVCVVVGKVKVGWDVACALGSETEEG